MEALSPILVSLIDFLKDAKEDSIQFMNIINYKIGYATDIAHNLLFIFVTDLTDEDANIDEQLEIMKYEFFSRFEHIIDQNVDYTHFTSFDDITDEIFKELRPKIALIGFSGVGKTTITRLIRAEDIPMRHVPTITGDVATIKIGHVNLYIWDFAGQEKYSFVWNKFVKGADAVILILDSTEKNVKESKFFIELVKKEEPHAKLAIVANKQDLPDALPPERIEELLGVKTTGLIAIDTDSRENMLYIIVDTLKIRSLVAPFVAPLLQRDDLIAEAEAAIMAGNIAIAASKFEQISQLSDILEEPEMSVHFKSQADVLRVRLQEMTQMAQIPVREPIDKQKIEKHRERQEERKKDKKGKKEEKKKKKEEEEEEFRIPVPKIEVGLERIVQPKTDVESLLSKFDEKVQASIERSTEPITTPTQASTEQAMPAQVPSSPVDEIDYKINLLISQYSKGEVDDKFFQTELNRLQIEKSNLQQKSLRERLKSPP